MNLPRRWVSLVALASFLLCESASIPPATAEPNGSGQVGNGAVAIAIGAGIVIGTVALIEVFHHKRTIHGCVTEGPDGLQIVDDKDHSVYLLRGKTEKAQPGLDAAIRGKKKKKKHELVFVVKKVHREYGPCGQAPAMVAVAASVPVPAPAPPPLQHRNTVDIEASINATGTAALYGVEFDTNSSALRLDDESTLHKALAVIQKRPDARWVIAGYTDDRGSADLNQRLSDARANSVRDWLIGQGVAEDRLSAQGYGASNYVADNSTDEGRAKNRRVELQIAK